MQHTKLALPFRYLCLTLTLIFVATAVYGCGDKKTESAESTAQNDSTSSKGAVKIAMKDFSFQPETVAVKVGQKIVWRNEDSADHNVVADSGANFKSDEFGTDETFAFTPTKAGTVKYQCTLHPGMTGTITVR